jgi:hypothetical protein
MERRRFTRQFKLEAVRLIKDRVLPSANCSAGGNRARGHHSRAMEISLDCLTP